MGQDGSDVGLGTEVEVFENGWGSFVLDVVVWCYDEINAGEGAIRDRTPMQWSVSRFTEVFWEEDEYTVSGDIWDLWRRRNKKGRWRCGEREGEMIDRRRWAFTLLVRFMNVLVPIILLYNPAVQTCLAR